VVFLNGYESDCGGASFKSAFGIADQVLQASGQVSLFFNYCELPGRPSIEVMGAAFGALLSGLRYEDGQPLDLVDVVAHSMGGLIVRSYLSGKGSAAGVFNPPAVTHIRKIVFLATPHFGTGVNIGLPFSNAQVDELTSASRFLFDLATWNQGTDDLRGVDAIAVIGDGGTGRATTNGFDDGVIALTSASLGFYLPGRTRVVPFCHVDGGGVISLSGYCGFNALGIAVFR
jgi:pimeloyl-ACP methyl ester carboxylesterase